MKLELSRHGVFMRKRSFILSVALMLSLLALAPVARAGGFTLRGTANEEPSGRGLPQLTIRLIPPRASKLPDYVTTTGSDGTFRLEGVPAGSYVLEAKEGATPVFRRTIAIEHDTTEEIRLETRPAPTP